MKNKLTDFYTAVIIVLKEKVKKQIPLRIFSVKNNLNQIINDNKSR
ncbi:hypothetical protein ABR850_04010 [Aeromonas veronii]